MAENKHLEVKAFLHRMLTNARTAGADTIVISAELLYGMTVYFHKLEGRQRNYWSSEVAAINMLRSALPREITKTKIVSFFRRQDHFLESFYQEVIKLKAVTSTIDEFKNLAIDLLNYHKNMEIWRDVFGDCVAFRCDDRSNSTETFLREVLEVPNITQLKDVKVRRNTRMNRDVLEYKRILNGFEMSRIDRYMSKLACKEIARSAKSDRRYERFIDPESRAALMTELECCNRLLSEKFRVQPFAPLSDDDLKDWQPYPGLSADRLGEFRMIHARIKRSASYQSERWGLLLRGFVLEHLPAMAWMLSLGRAILPRHRRRV
jgi:hypothetical protein